MSKPRKIDISLEKLIEIATAINKNTIANRSRAKEDKILTDKFIRKFDITRKNFSATIKGTGIQYNKSTFLYDVPEINKDNKNKSVLKEEAIGKSETFVVESETHVNQVNKLEHKSETFVVPSKKRNEIIVNPESETFVSLNKNSLVKFDERLKNIENREVEIQEMLQWYRDQKEKDNIIDVEIPEIKIDKDRLNEDAITRGFKIYPSVIAHFKEFCKKNNQYTMQDLMAMALIEYVDKYKK